MPLIAAILIQNLAIAWGLVAPTRTNFWGSASAKETTLGVVISNRSTMPLNEWQPSSKQQLKMMPAAWMHVAGTMMATATGGITFYNNQLQDNE